VSGTSAYADLYDGTIVDGASTHVNNADDLQIYSSTVHNVTAENSQGCSSQISTRDADRF
jgi:hypothetical protein